MSWSYSGNPAASDKDEVRFLIQDVRADEQKVSDEEISYMIVRLKPVYDDNLMVGAHLCEAIAAGYAGEGTVSADGVSASFAEVQRKYQDLAIRLRVLYAELRGAGGGPQLTADDRRSGMFALGMSDIPGTGQRGYGDLAPWPTGVPAGTVP